MMHSPTLRLIAGALASLAAGCVTLPQPPPPTRQLTAAESRAVESCHRTIGRLSAQFVTKATRTALRCVDRAVGLRLEEDRSFVGGDLSDVLAKRRRVRDLCTRDFEKVGADSTRLIDGIIAKCGPVQDLILDDLASGDPLRFVTLNALLEAFDIDELRFDTVPELAGAVCGENLQVIGEMLFFQAPRISDAAEVTFAMEIDELADYARSFTDARCRDLDA